MYVNSILSHVRSYQVRTSHVRRCQFRTGQDQGQVSSRHFRIRSGQTMSGLDQGHVRSGLASSDHNNEG